MMNKQLREKFLGKNFGVCVGVSGAKKFTWQHQNFNTEIEDKKKKRDKKIALH